MKTLLWKELRENLRWATLAMIAFGGALCYTLYHHSDSFYGSYEGMTLCHKTFLMVTTFGCPAIGLFLGLMQVLPELNRDRWAALLHRPVRRGTVFWGKAISGCALYGLATLPPFALVVWLVSTPGNFAVPFVPAMMKPGLTDIATGAAYYFAALLMGLQRGGPVILRAFPLLAAVHLSYFVLSRNFMYVAMEAIVAMAVALMLAAWGAIHNQDRVSGRPWIGRLAFLIVIYYGACGMADMATSLLAATGPSPRREFLQYVLTKEGVPLQLHYINQVVAEVSDLDGQPAKDPKHQPDRVRNHLIYPNQVSSYIGDSHGWKPRRHIRRYRNSETYLLVNPAYQYPRLEQWFHLIEQRSLVCYSPDKKLAVAQLDGNGFQPPSAAPVPFPADVDVDSFGADRCILNDPREMRLAFLARREIMNLPLPAQGPVFGSTTVWGQSEEGTVRLIGAAFSDCVAIYDDEGKLATTLPYHHDVSRWGRISLGMNEERSQFYLWYQPSAWINPSTQKSMPSYLDAVDIGGQTTKTYVLPPLRTFPQPLSLDNWLKRRLQSPAFFYGNMMYQKIGASLGSERLKGMLTRQFNNGWKTTKEIMLWTSVVSCLFAVATFLLAWRARFVPKKTVAWVLFVLAGNLAGFITFLISAEWPRLLACPKCRTRRPVHAANCPSCASPWPSPDPNGFDIFDRPAPTEKPAS